MTSKEQVLEFLQHNQGYYLSGEEMAAQLQLSRNAVWKAMKVLRRDGYVIDAVTKRGYRLLSQPDRLNVERIQELLERMQADRSKQEGSRSKQEISANSTGKAALSTHYDIRLYQEIDSTNQEAKKEAILGAKHGTVILAERQNAGNGRRNHKFASPEGGLYFSIILRPEHLKEQTPEAIMDMSLRVVKGAIQDVIGCELTAHHNDLFLDGRKVCGILTESGVEFESNLLQWVVVGIGINVRTRIGDLPEDVQEVAGSLLNGDCRATQPVMNELVAEMIRRFDGEMK
ncbi:MAG: biotin--[acetyl-CoA-carboxylase] ligase [Lachnospiraceae bacterium]|nr:biotin--[acetyl-CoA-carboxylase] ligase [Lachnospiraceae bacterium]